MRAPQQGQALQPAGQLERFSPRRTAASPQERRQRARQLPVLIQLAQSARVFQRVQVSVRFQLVQIGSARAQVYPPPVQRQRASLLPELWRASAQMFPQKLEPPSVPEPHPRARRQPELLRLLLLRAQPSPVQFPARQRWPPQARAWRTTDFRSTLSSFDPTLRAPRLGRDCPARGESCRQPESARKSRGEIWKSAYRFLTPIRRPNQLLLLTANIISATPTEMDYTPAIEKLSAAPRRAILLPAAKVRLHSPRAIFQSS